MTRVDLDREDAEWYDHVHSARTYREMRRRFDAWQEWRRSHPEWNRERCKEAEETVDRIANPLLTALDDLDARMAEHFVDAD
jgi:hypothetical protein